MVVHGPFPHDMRVDREARAARDLGFDVELIAIYEEGKPSRETVAGLSVTRLPIRRRIGGGAFWAVVEYIGFTALAVMVVAGRSLRRRYSIVQIHTPPDFLVAAALIPKLLGARVILDVHDLGPDMFEMRFGSGRVSRLLSKALLKIEKAAVRISDEVITVHEPYRRELARTGVPIDAIGVVMNSIDEDLLPRPLPRSTEPFRIVYHGTVTPPYGVELLIEAMPEILSEAPAAQLEIYGTGDALPNVRRRAEELGLAERVYTTGRFDPHFVTLRAINGASVGVIPNLPTRLNRYALSSKLFEYIALNIPVVCSALPTLREHFEESELLFFEPGRHKALAAAIRAIAADPAAAASRAAAARTKYALYDWNVNRPRYCAVLTRLRSRPALVPSGVDGSARS
jgi:glycosyltransferase involved in cell wall biosynthesis